MGRKITLKSIERAVGRKISSRAGRAAARYSRVVAGKLGGISGKKDARRARALIDKLPIRRTVTKGVSKYGGKLYRSGKRSAVKAGKAALVAAALA